ncbi:unnamed protein product [Larinioides sclopetarius]|uniref:Ribosomal protein L32 n=1 Tax=Larinioides sclopetarius TaxID=280406 RepID=A0AAV1ZD36_9ARAC
MFYSTFHVELVFSVAFSNRRFSALKFKLYNFSQ